MRRAYLSEHLTPLNQPYDDLLHRYSQSLQALGVSPADLQARALGLMNSTLSHQANIQAYMDVFAICAIGAFCVVPLTFLFRGTKAGGGGPPAH